MDIEAVIAEATNVAEPAKAPEGQAVETPQEPIVKEEAPKTDEVIEPKTDDALTPEQLIKREANRRSHQNSREAKMKRELRDLRELVQKVTSQPTPQAQPVTDGRPAKPNPDNYQDWDTLQADTEKYHEDLADWKVEQKLSERDKKSAQVNDATALNAQTVKRIEEIAAKEADFIKSNPDYTALYQDHKDFMDNLPLPVAEALMEADDANLALYALMREGSLESLESMSPYRISMEIGKAEIRGEKYLNQNKATNAPPPVEAARGTGNPSKALHEKSVDELLKHYNNRR